MRTPRKDRCAVELRPCQGGYEVTRRGTVLGKIQSTTEPSGRVAFLLAADRRRNPRTYRGRLVAAEAVAALYDLATAARKQRMQPEQIVLAAWTLRPPSSFKQPKRSKR
jgi:hypothetical protein